MSKPIRYGLGLVVSALTVYDLFTITTTDTLKYHEQAKLKNKKILTIVNLPFVEPAEGDLVLTLDNKKYQFRIVETASRHYSQPGPNGMSVLVPRGFLMLKNPQNGARSLECFGSVVGQINFDVTWLTDIFSRGLK